jgi:hypothetical protein
MKVLCSQELASPPHKGIVPYQVTAKVSAPQTPWCVPWFVAPQGDVRRGWYGQKPLIFMHFHGVFLGSQHEIWSKQHNGKVSTLFGALTNLTLEDAIALIDFRWKVAGGSNHPFDNGALEAIFKYSKGLPRKISKIADNALIRAMSSELLSIDKEIIEQVASEVRLTEEFEYIPKNKAKKAVKKK